MKGTWATSGPAMQAGIILLMLICLWLTHHNAPLHYLPVPAVDTTSLQDLLLSVSQEMLTEAKTYGNGRATGNSADWYANIAMGYYDRFRLDNSRYMLDTARQLLNKAIHIDSLHADYYYSLACTYLRTGEYSTADSFCLRAVAVDSGFMPALTCLVGLRRMPQHTITEIHPFLRRIISSRPDYPQYHKFLGDYHMANGNRDSALACYRAEITTNTALVPPGAPSSFSWVSRATRKESHRLIMDLCLTHTYDISCAASHRDSLLSLAQNTAESTGITADWKQLVREKVRR